MTRLFRDLPIKRKLMTITMLTSCLALVLTCVAFVAYEQHAYRRQLAEELATTAGIIGDNCASALSFDDPEAAEEVLHSLNHQPSITGAAVYDDQGKLFALYRNASSGASFIPPPAGRGSTGPGENHAEQFRDIRLAGETIGSIYIRHDMEELRELQANYVKIATVVLLGASLVSWLVSSWLQRVISRPVGALAGVVAQVADRKDYSLRAEKQGEDEMGSLIDGFNDMLDQIQRRDSALQAAQDELEARVKTRTAELANSLSVLAATVESSADGIFAVHLGGQVVSYNSRFTDMWRIPPDVIASGDSAVVSFTARQVKDPDAFISRIRDILARPEEEASDVVELMDGRIFERYCKPQRIDGRSVGLVINYRDVTRRRRADEELRWKTAFLEAQADSSLDGILVVDKDGRRFHQNRKSLEMWNVPLPILESENEEAHLDYITSLAKDPAKFRERVMYLNAHPDEIGRDEVEMTDGRSFDRYSSPVFGKDGTFYGRIWTFRDITERKKAEAEAQRLNRQLLHVSRQAGMSEVATSVLHNVGNVLNSVNISCSVISEMTRRSRVGSVVKAAELLRKNEAELAASLTADPAGAKLPEFLAKLAARLSEEQKMVIDELDLLERNIGHIKEIVAVQQTYAKNFGGILDVLALETLVNDALRMNEGPLSRHRIDIVREFGDVPPVPVEKHKVLQILVNLIRNAKHALVDSGRADPRLVVGTSIRGCYAAVSVTDNGIGVPPENLTRIFAHGFTTKPDGHGFGLHSGVLAAQEMGGSLRVRSGGHGTGATFTLELPLDPASVS